jgi:hypothetical protein
MRHCRLISAMESKFKKPTNVAMDVKGERTGRLRGEWI